MSDRVSFLTINKEDQELFCSLVFSLFNPEEFAESMETDSDSNSVSEAGKSISVPVFPKKLFAMELGDLNENPGSLFPSFFMQLPTELKLKILDSVSGVDIAKASCVCSELRYLASSDDVWEQKYVAQFGNSNIGLGSEGSFKERFVKSWEGRKSGSGGLCFNNIMRRNRFHPFGCDLGGDDEEWLEIVRLCLPRVGVNSSTQELNADVTL